MSMVARRSLVLLVSVLVVMAGVFVVQRANAASSTPVVYVATGENFPDALGAASAVAVQGGPVLLVQKDSIPAVTAAELTRLSPDVIYVAGGTAVVSDSVFTALKAYAPSVVRVAGANRYATAVEVSKSAFPVTGGGTAALEARVAELEALLAGVTRNGTTLLFSGMNLQVVNGEGSTATNNSRGNVIIGYNEVNPGAERGSRVGSHYLVVGDQHSYVGHSAVVSGHHNTSAAPYAAVLGGSYNTASGENASVTGGYLNTAQGSHASATGGYNSEASGNYSSVNGGRRSAASGIWASVSGGADNTASGLYSSILGGSGHTVSANYGHYPG